MGEIEYQVRIALPGTYQVAVEVLTPDSRGKNKSITAFLCKGSANSGDLSNLIMRPQESLKSLLVEVSEKLHSALP